MTCKNIFITILLVVSSITAQYTTNSSRSLHLDFITQEVVKQDLLHTTYIDVKQIDYTTLSVQAGVATASMIYLHSYLRNHRWKGWDSDFKHLEEGKKYGYIDKYGRFYLANQLHHFVSAALEFSNLESEKTYIYGAVGAVLFGSYLEIADAYSLGEGFSSFDLLSTGLGAGYALSQYYFPILKEIQPRMSYFPSKIFSDANEVEDAFNDYEGQKYWLGLRVNNLLPESIADYWPDFLMLSLGIGVKNTATVPVNDIYLAFDIDVEELPLYGPYWQFIKNTLNYIHFPLPGVRLTNGVVFYGLCF